MEEPRIVSTADAPAAIGPYSQAVAYGGLVFCSGQIALVPATGELVAGGVEEQTKQVLENLSNLLEASGSAMGRVLKTTVFLKDMGDYAKVNAVYATFFPEDTAPARAAVEVARLPKDVLVEIDCIAALSS